MAVRSGAGTGVVVSLVVFIFATIFGIVFTIVFYTKATKEEEARINAEQTLEVYIRAAQRNADQFKELEAAAGRERQSVAQFLTARYERLMGLVDGTPRARFEEVQTRAASLGADTTSVLNALETTQRQLRNRDTELQSRNQLVAEKDQQISNLQGQIDQLRAAHQQQIISLQDQIGTYAREAERYRDDVANTVSSVEATVHRQRDDYNRRIGELQSENDTLRQRAQVTQQRLTSLQNIIGEQRARSVNPALLVDGTIVDTTGADEVYIDRGRADRIVLGMTFEVFSSADAIRVDPNTGEISRGKGSIQIISVGENSSRGKVTRSVPGRPVVRNDVIANAVYDPNYEFKFLVHGRFDVDGDGRATESEADFVRQKIIEWGGTVVTGEELPGDLDFLVLGVEPPRPMPPSPNMPVEVINDRLRQQAAWEQYQNLFSLAREAQIPVLNSNRFFILTGRSDF